MWTMITSQYLLIIPISPGLILYDRNLYTKLASSDSTDCKMVEIFQQYHIFPAWEPEVVPPTSDNAPGVDYEWIAVGLRGLDSGTVAAPNRYVWCVSRPQPGAAP